MMWQSRRRNADADVSAGFPLMQRLSAKLHLWGEAMAGVDDPLGDYLARLEERVRHLEDEVQKLSKPPSANAAASGTRSPN